MSRGTIQVDDRLAHYLDVTNRAETPTQLKLRADTGKMSNAGMQIGANQGSFIIVVDLNRFLPIAQFKAEMDEYARRIRQMQPLKGFDRAVLAGAIEWENERQRAVEGIPVGPQHAAILQRLAAEANLTSPI